MGPRKGVISQSVKDVVQSLVDDDMVLREKIGTSIYFWSLPSQAGNQVNVASLGASVCKQLTSRGIENCIAFPVIPSVASAKQGKIQARH